MAELLALKMYPFTFSLDVPVFSSVLHASCERVYS